MLNILYVDDDADLREIVAAALHLDAGIAVEAFASAALARDALARSLPDLVMLDVMMPGTDGPTFLRELQAEARTAALPVIFITAKVQRLEMERFLALGAIGIIEKPFNPRTLAAKVRDLSNHPAPTPAPSPSETLEAVQERLRARFRAEAPLLARRLIDGQALAPASPESTVQLLHILAGMAGTLGFDDIGARAGHIHEAAENGEAIAAELRDLALSLSALG